MINLEKKYKDKPIEVIEEYHNWINYLYKNILCKTFKIKPIRLELKEDIKSNWVAYIQKDSDKEFVPIKFNINHPKTRYVKCISKNYIPYKIVLRKDRVEKCYKAFIEGGDWFEIVYDLIHEMAHYEYRFHTKRFKRKIMRLYESYFGKMMGKSQLEIRRMGVLGYENFKNYKKCR